MEQLTLTKNPHSFSTISIKSIIQMNDVWASYDSKNYILKNITLSIDRGTNYAIVGQSGSGKSTLLKLMNGMMLPSKGIVKIDYQAPDIKNKKFKSMMSKIGYIPQSLGLVKNMSVLENILIGALPRIGKLKSMFKIFPEEEIQEAHKILKLVRLEDKAERKAYMLSGGEKRRVAIARALMQKPDILLADEIVSELDHVTARDIMDLIADAQEKFNLTAIMVHHDIQLALEYANRVAVIDKGEKILEIGVEGDTIIDFQTGNLTRQEILEMYSNES
ncbi:MAG: phosphonate ABC transporter ATP-binding protein [Nitrosopumilaceae archaeon]